MKLFFGLSTTIFLPVLLGSLLAMPFHPLSGISGTLAAGVVTGLTVFTALAYLWSLLWGVSWLAIGMALFTFLVLVACARRYLARDWEDEPMGLAASSRFVRIVAPFVFVGFVILLWAAFREVLWIRPSGYAIGFIKNFGDLPLHLHFASSFAFADNIPPANPIYYGVPLRYPFLGDFYSAVIWFATGSVEIAFEWPGFFLGVALLVFLWEWVAEVTGSRLAVLLAPALFFLDGSTGGILEWGRDLLKDPHEMLPRLYTMMESSKLVWANVIHALLIPQRGLQFALPLAVFFFATALEAAQEKDWRAFLFLAILFLPFPYFHGHAALALMIFGGVLFWFYPSLAWVALIVPLGLAWAPQILYLSGMLGAKVVGAQSFLRLSRGFEVQGWENLWFWVRNTGPFIPLAFYGLWLAKKEARVFGLAAFITFAIGNFVVLAPWSWDNIKLLLFWYLGALPLVALALARLFEASKWGLRVLGGLLFLSLILPGTLDLTHALRKNSEDHDILSRADVEVADWIRKNVPKKAIFLAAPTYNQPLVLTGRTMFLGYPGHIWSHGLPLPAREQEVRRMARGEPGALELMRERGITHVIFGQREQAEHFERPFFEQNFTYLGNVAGHILYRVK